MNENLHIVHLGDKEVLLLGTAHVSKQSVQEVDDAIKEHMPDMVMIELDEERYQSLTDGNNWKNTNIYEIIKQKKGMMLLANIVLSAYQRRIGAQLGVQAGAEMMQAIESAKREDVPIGLADRNIKTTFIRIWRKMKGREKIKLLFGLVMSLFDDTEITEEELEELKQQDIITSALNEMGSEFSGIKEVLVDERDKYMAEKIRRAEGKKVLAVVGGAHIGGILENLEVENDLEELNKVPQKGKTAKIVGWIIPAIIVILLILSFRLDADVGWRQLLSWLLINGSLSALGALIALGRPLTILTAFAAAPITSLNPLLAAGWFAGLVEAYITKPAVKDFESLYDDVSSFKGFWKNKITRVLLVTAFANIGSMVGTFIAGLSIIRSLWGIM